MRSEANIRRRALLAATLAAAGLILALTAQPASAAERPQQEIATRSMTLGPGEDKTIRWDCSQPYEAVAAAVVSHDPLVAVYSLRRINDTTWEVGAKNFNPGNGGRVTVELRCVLKKGFSVRWDPQVEELTEDFRVFDEKVRCKRGRAPISTGFAHYPPDGKPGDAPPDNAAVSVFDNRFEPGGFATLLRSTGSDPVAVLQDYGCVKREVEVRNRFFNQRVVQLTVPLILSPNDGERVNGRCPRGSIATGLGFNTPDDRFVFVEPLGWTGARAFHFVAFNPQGSEQTIELEALCLEQTVTRR
jgi:hypothetical protein